MSKGTKVRSIRITDSTYYALQRWGQNHLGTTKFSVIVRHIIATTIGRQ